MTLLFLSLAITGCEAILDVDDERASDPCDEATFRCAGNVLQRCESDLTWHNEQACGGTSPVCSEDRCVGVSQVASGGAHSCAVLSDGKLRCWGKNSDGQLGDGSTDARSKPVGVHKLAGPVRWVAVGGSDDFSHSCAVLQDGTVKCWGDNTAGQLGDGTQEDRSTPVTVEGLTGVRGLALGFNHSCALLESGDVYCWGYNVGGILAGSGGSFLTEPVAIQGLHGIESISAGGLFTCARTNKEVYCWGINSHGQCGQPESEGAIFPPRVVEGVVNPSGIAVGYRFSCALQESGDGGEVMCWGLRDCGQTGNGYCDTVTCTSDGACSSSIPEKVVMPVEAKVTHVAAGGNGACALLKDFSDRVYCWGRNDFLQAGTPFGAVVGQGHPFVPTPNPTTIVHVGSVSPGSHYPPISSGSYHSCALTTAGPVRCWGRNDFGQLGDGTNETTSSTAVVW